MIVKKIILKIINNLKFLIFKIMYKSHYFIDMSDEKYLKTKYFLSMGNKLNLNNPKKFNEKLQWLKLYDRKAFYTNLVDKYEVRSFISEILGPEYLIPIYGIYEDYTEINFDTLPDQFVLKPTHTSGNVFICKDKKSINHKKLRKETELWLKRNYYKLHREWPYKNIKPRLIIEKLMIDEGHEDIKDYKLMVFNGEVKYTLVVSDRNVSKHAHFDFFDNNWNHMSFGRPNSSFSNSKIKQPKNFNTMLNFAEKIAKKMPFVRVDFYEINEKIYFGEITFYPSAGFEKYDPEEYDEHLGNLLILPKKLDKEVSVSE